MAGITECEGEKLAVQCGEAEGLTSLPTRAKCLVEIILEML